MTLAPTLAERLRRAAKLLEPITETPRLDAEILLAHCLEISRAQLLSRLRTNPAAPAFEEMLKRRLAFEPIAYIIGEWEFYSLNFKVEAPLLVPRPETEHLVEAALNFLGGRPARLLDLCTGTGCVAVAIAHHAPQAAIIATDTNPQALRVTRENAERHGVAQRLQLRQGDLFEALQPGDGPFDVVCSNPPYVEEGAWPELSPVIRLHEDPGALLAGADGLDAIRRLVAQVPDHLRPGGLLAFELGLGQYTQACNLMAAHGFERVTAIKDLAGIDRIVMGTKPAT